MSVTTKNSWRRMIPSIGSQHADDVPARTLYALATLLFLVKLPHLLYLPAWVGAAGILLVGARLALLKHPTQKLLGALLSPLSVTVMAAASALLIKWHFGYFIGRDPCVAFLFILVAAKFAEVRRPGDATLLLCLCAFLLLTQYFYSQSIISATLTIPAVFALAYSLSVLRDAGNPENAFSQLRLISVLMLQGLPLAALLFIVFPRLPGPLWSLPEDAMATTGLSDSMSPGSIGKLSQSDEVAFRVEFDGNVPQLDRLYWRGPVLTEFDGQNWQLSRVAYEARPQFSGPDSDVLNYTVTLQAHQQRWLFALEAPISLPGSYNAAQSTDKRYNRSIGKLYDDGQILANETVSQTLRYSQSSVLRNTLPALGKPRSDTLYLPGRNTRTIDFARQLRKEFQTDEAYANSVMRYFNEEPFRYTLQPQLLGHAPVDEFMFDSREGFCEHYAAAFVVMMRAAGIPSRVVTGYQGGEMNGDYMIVRQSSAHAWTEVYLDEMWVRFDPTSVVAPSRIQGGLAAALPNEASVPRLSRQSPGLIRSLQLRWDALNHHWQRLVIDFDNDSQASLWERTGLGKPALWQIALLVICLTGLWSMVVLGMPRQATRVIPAQERCWQKLSRLLQTRINRRAHDESPAEFLHRAASVWPSQGERILRLEEAFTRLRFQQLDEPEQARLMKQIRHDVFRLRLSLPFQKWPQPFQK